VAPQGDGLILWRQFRRQTQFAGESRPRTHRQFAVA
jgi:hypothetical protein